MAGLPQHIAIIMDGNGRWAELRGIPRTEGHRRGSERAKEIIEACLEIGIKNLTLYAFSVENWQRPLDEVFTLMELLKNYLNAERDNMKRQGIRLITIGNKDMLPRDILTLIRETEDATKDGKVMNLILCLSYGGRDEIIRAVRKLLKEKIDPHSLNEDNFKNYLDTADIPDPDLMIRTSGERRLSNFLIYQSAYTELYFTETLWPDFTKDEFLEAIQDYQKRQRRFGRVVETINRL
ncbi:MAG: polyprenyl diphosphate synthase [Thermodesulfovibrionales bacterium]